MSSGPPKHEMQYFPNMTSALPSESAEFRRVLWTGLYSQVVLMTVPVGGDIGDEASLSPPFLLLICRHCWKEFSRWIAEPCLMDDSGDRRLTRYVYAGPHR